MIKYNKEVINKIINKIAESITLIDKVDIESFKQVDTTIKISINCLIKNNIYDILNIIKDFTNLIKKNITSIYDLSKTDIKINLFRRK